MRSHASKALWPATVLDEWMPLDCEPGLASLIIPTYNRAHLLVETLHSLQSQTYRPLEAIIVDDGSTDNTLEVIQQWEQSASHCGLRVSCIRQENQGANVARNRGLVASSGEYVQFLDSDDVLHPQQLEWLVKALNSEPECDLAWSRQVKASSIPEGFANQFSDSDAAISPIQSADRNPMVFPKNRGSVLLRRHLCVEAGPWDESLARWQDMEYMFRVAALRPSCRYVDRPLYLLREHAEGRIHDLYEKAAGIEAGLRALERVERIIRVAEQDHDEARYCVARYYLGLAKLAMAVGDQDEVWQALDGAYRWPPSKRFLMQLRLVRIAYSALGPHPTRLLLNAYTWARSV